MLRPYNVCETYEKLAARRMRPRFSGPQKNEHTGHARDGKQSIRHRVGEGTISFAEIASEWAHCGIFGWAGGDAGAETGDGRGSELFCECEREYVRGLCDQPEERRDHCLGAGGDGGFLQLRFE